MTRICNGNQRHQWFRTSDNGLSPDWRQVIIWNNAGILLIGPIGTNFSEILFKIDTFSFKKMHLKNVLYEIAAILSRPQCVNTETKMSSFWWNFHHWLHRKLSKWQLSVQPVTKISSKWWHFRFSERLISAAFLVKCHQMSTSGPHNLNQWCPGSMTPYCITTSQWVNSSAPGQNGLHFVDNIFKCIFMNEKCCIFSKNSLKFVPKRPIDNYPELV